MQRERRHVSFLAFSFLVRNTDSFRIDICSNTTPDVRCCMFLECKQLNGMCCVSNSDLFVSWKLADLWLFGTGREFPRCYVPDPAPSPVGVGVP